MQGHTCNFEHKTEPTGVSEGNNFHSLVFTLNWKKLKKKIETGDL